MVQAEVHGPMEPPEPEVPIEVQKADEPSDQEMIHPPGLVSL